MNSHQRTLYEDLKPVRNLVQLINARVPLKPAGRSYRGNCCLHEDHDRSFYVFPGRERWRCFGQCDSGGDAVEFLMRADKITFGEAVRRLAVEYGLAPPKATSKPETLDGRTCSLRTMQDNIVPDQFLFASASRERERKRQLEIQAQAYERLIGTQRSKSELRLCSDGRWRPNYYYDDGQLTVGNLGYKGKINRPGGINGLRRSLSESRPVGIVVALPSTLENHVEIETPDGRIRTEDLGGIFNAGEITWVEGEAIYKDVMTNEHNTATLLGCSTMGFCLIEPIGTPPFWIAPKEPEEAGGRDRPFTAYVHDVGGKSVRLLSLESFFIHDSIDGKIPDSYKDVSGIEVQIEIPKYSLKRHADRNKRNRSTEIGGD